MARAEAAGNRVSNRARAAPRRPGPAAAKNATADRAIDVLLLFSRERPLWSAAEIAAHFGMPRSTTYRYLTSLTSYGLLAGSAKGFRLGARILLLARIAREGIPVIGLARPRLESLAARFGELVVLQRRLGTEIEPLERIESRHRVSVTPTRSHLLPWPATASAKVLLAFAPEAERAELMRELRPKRYTARTTPDKAALERELAAIRRAGLAVIDEERDEGVWGAAAPVFEADPASAQYCIAMAVPRFRVDAKRAADLVGGLKTEARRLSKELHDSGF